MGKKDGFHSPFAAVARDLKKKMEAEEQAKIDAGKQAKARAAAPKRSREDEGPELTFAEMMGGVRTAGFGGDPRGKTSGKTPAEAAAARAARNVERERDDAEALATLAGMVESTGTLEPGEDVLEGWTPGLDKKVLRSLKRGDYGVDARLDLHGMREGVARDAVERFLLDAHARGHRAVLVIHGRGNNSDGGVPVIKPALQGWLAKGRATRHILAFCPAAPHDGGAGAVYVLLRR